VIAVADLDVVRAACQRAGYLTTTEPEAAAHAAG
jgi:hypothetical protein